MWLIGAGLFTINLLIIALTTAMRIMPTLFHFLRVGLRWLLVISFRLYHVILINSASSVHRTAGIYILRGVPRIVACIVISALIATGLMLLAFQFVALWGLALAGIHGLVVGLLWDEISEPDGLQIGVRLE